MKKLPMVLVIFACCAGTLCAQPAVRFRALDVLLDVGERPLAAYQLELTDLSGKIKIVGVEGGEHAAFREPPYYDPAALMNNRIILAAFSTSSDLPKGKTRIARVHVQITGEGEPAFTPKLEVAATLDGQRMPATLTITPGENK